MNKNRPRWIPEIFGFGFVAVVGAILWSKTFSPATTELETPAPKQPSAPLPGSGAGAPTIHWKSATAFQKKQASSSIVAQLEAFKKNDYTRAVKFQSSVLRRNFSSVEQFRGMMKASYPQFANYGRADFGEAVASPDGKMVEIAVRITGLDGVSLQAVYLMRRENGLYRVDAVSTGEPESTPEAPGITA